MDKRDLMALFWPGTAGRAILDHFSRARLFLRRADLPLEDPRNKEKRKPLSANDPENFTRRRRA